ncbi:MAG: hypothetical protein EZS28_043056, partial [Streblomastix strix]
MNCTGNRTLSVYVQTTINGTLYVANNAFDAIIIGAAYNRNYSLFNSDINITKIACNYNKTTAGITLNLDAGSAADPDNNKFAHNITIGTVDVYYNTVGSTLQLTNSNALHGLALITGIVNMSYNVVSANINGYMKTGNATINYNTTATETALGATRIRLTYASFSTAAYLADLVSVGSVLLQATYLTGGTKITSVALISGTEIEVGIDKPTILAIPASTPLAYYPIQDKTFGNMSMQYNKCNGLVLQYGQNAAHYLNGTWTIGAITVGNNIVNNSASIYFYGGTGTIANSRERFNITSIVNSYNVTGASVITTFQGRVFIGLAANVGTTNVLTMSNNIAQIAVTATDTNPLLVAEAYVTLYGRLSIVGNETTLITVGGSSYTSGATTPEATIQMKVPSVEVYNNNAKITSIRFMFQSVGGTGALVANWITLYNNQYTELAYLYSFLVGTNGILVGNGSAYNNDLYYVTSSNIIKNHTTADIAFNDAKAYDLTSSANVPKKTNTN